MKRGKDRRFRAVQRARRLRGDLNPGVSAPSTPRTLPGGMARPNDEAQHPQPMRPATDRQKVLMRHREDWSGVPDQWHEQLARAAMSARPHYTAQDHDAAGYRLELAALNLMNEIKDALGIGAFPPRLPTEQEIEHRRQNGAKGRILAARHTEVLRMAQAHRLAAELMRRPQGEEEA